MSESRKILAIIEPDSHPQEVVRRATWLAGLYDCSIELLMCDPNISPLGESLFLSNEAAEIKQRIEAAQQEILDELAAIARDAGIEADTVILEHRPIADGILDRALETHPRFVVKGIEYHSVAERSILVDTDWQLLRSCMFPLWLVKPHEMHEELRIVAAVDPTHSHDKPAALDQVIVDAANDVAKRADGDVHLLHTYNRLTGVGSEATFTFKPIILPVDELDKKIQAKHRVQLDALADANSIDQEHVHQLPGRTNEILPAFVRSHKIDLVVMGAIARWGIKRAIIGSTAERVLDMLPCDVLITRVSHIELD
ncbi:MAG: universal stress protein [Woeseiaceae bacterium]